MEIRREFFFGPWDGHYVICPFQTANEKSTSGRVSGPNGDPLSFSLSAAPNTGVAGRPGWDFQDLRAENMITNYKIEASPSGDENPEVPCRGLFTLPDHKFENSSADGTHYGERCHGIARAIESL